MCENNKKSRDGIEGPQGGAEREADGGWWRYCTITLNPLLAHSYLHIHRNTSHTELLRLLYIFISQSLRVRSEGQRDSWRKLLSHAGFFCSTLSETDWKLKPDHYNWLIYHMEVFISPLWGQKQIWRNYCTNKYGMHRGAGPQRRYRPTQHWPTAYRAP